MLGTISTNRLRKMKGHICDALSRLYGCNSALEETLKKTAGVLQYHMMFRLPIHELGRGWS